MDLVEVQDLLPAPGAAWQPGDAYLAGGTWLFSEPQPTLRRLLDLQAFGWPPLTVTADGVQIAATCTLAQLAAFRWPPPWGSAGVLARQCCDALLGSAKVQHEATVGGNICLALPAGPMTAFAAALDGVATLWSPDGSVRALPVADFVVGPRATALRPGELLRSVTLPAAALASRCAFRQISLSAYGRSAALVIGRAARDWADVSAPRAGTVTQTGGGCVLTVTASTPRPVRVRFEALPSAKDAVAAVDAAVRDADGWFADVHGHPVWRAAMTARLVGEVCSELNGAGPGGAAC